MSSSDKALMKIGTPIHMLLANGNCAPGFVTRWDDPQQTASVVALQHDADGFAEMFPHGGDIAHDSSCESVPEGHASFHLPGECVWGR